MKKSLIVLFSVIALFTLTACTGNDDEASTSGNSATEASDESQGSTSNQGGGNVLVAYFSLAENVPTPVTDTNTSASTLALDGEVAGATAYVAATIQDATNADIHSILVAEPYPDDFDETSDRNQEEQGNNERPQLQPSDLDISTYDTVFIGYPVWATGAPQAIMSFIEENDLSDKQVIPFCTHNGYGSGSSYSDIGEAVGQSELDGFDIEAEELPDSQETIQNWVASLDL
ncbi:flavodoxin [Enterococcus sp. AZ109]|uniref:flavodoxin n=1 Tax=Enterococcus sp. AZ109 TaxID=2774634 RepID=UPI003F2745DA